MGPLCRKPTPQKNTPPVDPPLHAALLLPSTVVHLHTTRSPSFLGLQSTNPYVTNTLGSDSIIWFVNTGILAQTSEFQSARDSDGHGTHVASIVAGSPVPGSGFFGFSVGLARGISPTARIAVYKVCWSSGCLLSDICKAFETAISDGVHIISLSLGSSRLPFYLDLLSIVSFRAFSNGIFVSASAGNDGPTLASVANEPPWITTVGARTINCDFLEKIHLDNNISVLGTSITLMLNDDFVRKHFPLHFVGQFNSSSKFKFSRQNCVLHDTRTCEQIVTWGCV
ncbi:integral membrane family protein [Hibiscus syriacus]|uniref:Integral membrane family protein n=1 Tax=Hibiscus syriacus TaxID=106335 RepID=A0A6A3CQ67_HIBSY|nr:integral membrane family protein [Hibiscus syriacus]